MTIFYTMSWMSDIKHGNISDSKCKMKYWNMNDNDTHVTQLQSHIFNYLIFIAIVNVL